MIFEEYQSTNTFLEGLAFSASASKGLLSLGTTVPIGDTTLTKDAMVGAEVGLALFGGKKMKESIDISFSYGEKTDKFTLFEMISKIRK